MGIGNLDSAQFDRFAHFADLEAARDGNTVARLDTEDPLGGCKISVQTGDKVHALFRGKTARGQNNAVRTLFKGTIAEMFGGESRIPAAVKEAMRLSDFDKGRPLTARRIMAVRQVIDTVKSDFDSAVAQAKANADTAKMYEGLDADGRARLDALIGEAVKACIADKDALDVVVKHIDRILKAGDKSLSSADSVKGKIDGIIANCKELRSLAKKNPDVMRLGKDLLDDLEGKSLPPGILGRIVGAVGKAKVDCMKKFSPAATAPAMHMAVVQFHASLQRAMSSSGAERALEGGDELEPCRNFVACLLVAKCGSECLPQFQKTFTSDTLTKLAAIYDKIFDGNFDKTGLSSGHIDTVKDQAKLYTKFLNAFKLSVDIQLGVAQRDFRSVVSFRKGFDMNAINAGFVLVETTKSAKKLMLQYRDEFVAKTVRGSGPAAKMLRGIYGARVGTEMHAPMDFVKSMTDRTVTAMLNWTVAKECKLLSQGRMEETGFAKNLARGLDVNLPGGKKLSKDIATACDELARFVARDDSATYAGLDPAMKQKVHVVMGLLTQQTEKAAFDGHGVALDPEGKASPFTLSGDASKDRNVYTLEFTGGGDLVLRFEGKKDVSSVQGKKGRLDAKPGSTFESNFSFKILKPELERLSQLDFSTFDDTAASQVFDDPATTFRNEAAVKKFEGKFQFNGNVLCYPAFSATIN